MSDAATSIQQFFMLVDKRGRQWSKGATDKRLPEVDLAKIVTEAADGAIYYNADADNRHRAYGFVMFDGQYYSTKRDFHSYREPLLDRLVEYHAEIQDSNEFHHRKAREMAEHRKHPTNSNRVQPTTRGLLRLDASITAFSESNAYYSATLRAMKDIVEQPIEFFEAQAAEWLLEIEGDGDFEYGWLKRAYEKAGRPGNLTITDLIQLLKSAGAMVRPENDRLYRIGAAEVQANLAALT